MIAADVLSGAEPSGATNVDSTGGPGGTAGSASSWSVSKPPNIDRSACPLLISALAADRYSCPRLALAVLCSFTVPHSPCSGRAITDFDTPKGAVPQRMSVRKQRDQAIRLGGH
jgi:hypothetical protein